MSAADAAAQAAGVPRWIPVAALAAALTGLGVSIYLTIAHYSTTAILACPENATVNCEKVTTSAQSEILGIPVAVLGLAFYVVMPLLNLPAAWRSGNPWIHRLRLLAAAGGVAFVAWLVYAELFVIDAICLWCTSVHVLTLLMFGLVAFGTALMPRAVE